MALTARQVLWASTHDWFIADLGDGTILVKDDYTTDDGEVHIRQLVWTESFRHLRDWAGY